jgi:hypothetical protein
MRPAGILQQQVAANPLPEGASQGLLLYLVCGIDSVAIAQILELNTISGSLRVVFGPLFYRDEERHA